MLQACLNGGRTKEAAPSLPVTAAELALDAAAVIAAGADALHIHPRGPDGAETLRAEPVAETLRAIRAAAPGAPLGVGTGAWIAPGGAARRRDIAGWTETPDYASVNLHEEDCFEVMALLSAKGVAIEAGVWTLDAAERLIAETPPPPILRVLVEMTSDDPAAARAEASAVIDRLGEAGVSAPVLLHGEGGSAWACVAMAAELHLATRIGFEDVLSLPSGAPAQSNAALVTAARSVIDDAKG